MMDTIQQVNSVLHNFIWGRGTLILILFTGVLLTVRTGFFQFTHWRLWMGQTREFDSCISKKSLQALK